MKIFERETKVNFVDKNDAFVGYDVAQQCCEDAGYFFCSDPENPLKSEVFLTDEALDEFTFDTSYFDETDGSDTRHEITSLALFRLVSDKLPPVYLALYNAHNGYYHHGFIASRSGKPWAVGKL